MDTQLVIRAQGGDEAAFDAVVDAAYGRLQQVAYRILRDPQLAEDATQQALVRIWRKLPRLSDPAKFDAWSYRLLVNACSDEARKTRRSLPDLSFSLEPIARSGMDTVDDRDQLERGFRRLSVEQRAVVVLHHYLGMSVSDVAEALGIPTGTAHSRLDRAMAKLRLALRRDDPTGSTAPQEVAR
jgi:RNA polymerase sigma-70 factor (ECF subfamily)